MRAKTKRCRRCVLARTRAAFTCRGCRIRCCEHKCSLKLEDGSVSCGSCQTKMIKPGTVLFFVDELEIDDAVPHSWYMRQEVVKQVRKDGVVFERLVHGQVVHKRHTLGTRYHLAPWSAIEAFKAEKQEEIASAKRKIAEAERALEWARDNDPLVEEL